MLFLVKVFTEEMFEEAQCKFSIVNQPHFNQNVNTTWPVANALVDLLRIAGGSQQQCASGIIRRAYAIKHIENLLQVRRIDDKCLEVFEQDERWQTALRRHIECLGQILPGTAIAPRWSRRNIKDKAVLLCMKRALGPQKRCLAGAGWSKEQDLAQARHMQGFVPAQDCFVKDVALRLYLK